MDNNENKSIPAKQKEASTNLMPLSTLATVDDLNRLVDMIAESDLFNEKFKVNKKDEDGKLVRVVDKASVATCLVLGAELGFSPVQSIQLKDRLLDPAAVVKIHRGKDLGLSPMSSLDNIYVFPGGGREVVYTSVGVVTKCLLDLNVEIDFIEDGFSDTKTYHKYNKAKLCNKENQIDYDSSKHFIANESDEDGVKASLAEGKKPVLSKCERYAKVRLTRPGRKPITVRYSLQQAIDAGLYQGIHSITGETVKGKNNWNNHPMQHLQKMCIMIGGRVIAADKLNGIYSDIELTNASTIVDADDAEIVEEE